MDDRVYYILNNNVSCEGFDALLLTAFIHCTSKGFYNIHPFNSSASDVPAKYFLDGEVE